MVFSSLHFLFYFLPAVLLCYFLIPARLRGPRNLVLLLFSLLFYAYGEPLGIFVMLASITVNYSFARLVDRPLPAAQRRWLLIIALALNLGMLGYYKYTGFFLQNLNRLFATSILVPQIVMPIGISFFTFQGMSYLLDVYRGTCRSQRRILLVATYIALFPQLVAGPIVRYNTIEDELSQRQESWALAAQGARRFIRGLAKKMLLANSLGLIAAEMFSRELGQLSTAGAWLGAVAYTFQIFYDFSAYSDMAIGLGLIFGFHFPENFNYPYISRSITEFWTRWHMSLSGWFRDYVYIPLGGNRRGLPRQILNLLIVWCLTGLWHGAAWNFVLWGLYFFVILALEKLFLGRLLERLPRLVGHLYALLLIVTGWVLFNANGLQHAWGYFLTLWGVGAGPELGDTLYWLIEYRVYWLAALLFSLPLAAWLPSRWRQSAPLYLGETVALLLLFWVSIMVIVNASFNPFIYFRF